MAKRAASRVSASGSKAKASRTHASIPVAALSAPSRDQIERRAFELYIARGAGEGDALGDWLRAESELRGAR